MKVIVAETLRLAADRALSFLERRQLPSGEFNTKYTVHEAIDPATGLPEVRPDESPFSTSHIVHSLGYSGRPPATRMIARSMDYFRDQEARGGLWRHANDVPADVDDTACISEVLERFGGGAPNNKWLLLLNRDKRGLFYTWIIPRLVPTLNLRYWSIILSDVTVERTQVWKRTPARRDDVDAVVNANVAHYLGPVAESDPVLDHLLRVVRDGREDRSDRWYPDVNTYYYALSRCYARGMSRLSDAVGPMLARFSEQARADGRIGDNDMLTALAAAAILNFAVRSELLEPAIGYLLEAQQEDGGWSRQIFYTNGARPPQITWGSRELTTGFCLEVLERSAGTNAAA